MSNETGSDSLLVAERALARLGDAIGRLASAAERAAAPQERGGVRHAGAPARSIHETGGHCTHADGHALRLTVREAFAPTQAARECACCHARLWITIPTAGEQLEHIARDRIDIPDLHTALARRERQVLSVLHQAVRPMDHAQIAALVWADADRTHDVRTVLHRLRHKLRGSPWSIPTTPAGQGVRLVRSDSDDRQPVSIANVDAAGHAA